MYLSVFSARLKDLMLSEGVSRHKLSAETGAQRKSIANWLDGLNFPRYDALINVADYFKVSTDYLVGLCDIMREKVELRCPIAEVRPRLIAKLGAFMAEKGMTKYRLAKELNVEQSTLERWFKAGAMPEVLGLIRLTKLMGESLDSLLGRE